MKKNPKPFLTNWTWMALMLRVTGRKNKIALWRLTEREGGKRDETTKRYLERTIGLKAPPRLAAIVGDSFGR